MKKLILLSTVLGCLVATESFSMDFKPYAEVKLNQNFMSAEYKDPLFNEKFKDNVLGGSLAFGSKINDTFRVELEGYYNDKSEDKILGFVPVEMKTKGFFLNGYFDIPLPDTKKFKPYIGAGIGYSWLEEEVSLTDWNVKDKDWGYNVALGVSYTLTENVDLSLGYRYENLGELKDFDSSNEIKNSKVSFGVRYTF